MYLVTDAYTLQLDYEWLNDTQIELTEVMPQGVSFNIRRIVPRNDIVNRYTNGAILREYYLNDSFRQALMLLEEVADGFIAADGELLQLSGNLDMNGFSINNLADLDMGGNSIINLPEPIDGTSPARLQDLQEYAADNGILLTHNSIAGRDVVDSHPIEAITGLTAVINSKANVTTLAAHTGNITNPHAVTQTQVGLGNVNNTADVDKPISTAQQTALDNKVDDTQVLTNVPLGAVFTDTTYSVGV